jgi:hypothetical protein
MSAVSLPTSYDTPTSPLLPVVVNGKMYVFCYISFYLFSFSFYSATTIQHFPHSLCCLPLPGFNVIAMSSL